MKKYKYWLIPLFTMVVCIALAGDTFEPKEVVVPGGIKSLLDYAMGTRVVQLGTAAGVVIAVVTLLKMALLAFHVKLKGKMAFIASALVALLTTIGVVIQDETLSGTDWSALLSGLAIFIGATVGYRVGFSEVAKNEGPVVAVKTLLKSE